MNDNKITKQEAADIVAACKDRCGDTDILGGDIQIRVDDSATVPMALTVDCWLTKDQIKSLRRVLKAVLDDMP